MKDQRGREINYMRISITDRCNLRCKYCMPKDVELTSMSQILTYEEITQVAREAVGLGITRFRITGGEPLVRRGCEQLVGMLRDIPGTERITMTTNGVLLAEKAQTLKHYGLQGVNVSLDTLEAGEFAALTGTDALAQVLAGIDAAQAAGLTVKLNTVLRPETDWKRLIAFGEERQISLRFIEMMPIGYGREFPYRSSDALLEQMKEEYGAAVPDNRTMGPGPARYVRMEGLTQPVGLISAMDHSFCGDCNRVRMTAEGYLKLCLCYRDGLDVRAILRDEKRQASLGEAMAQAILQKPEQHIFHSREDITERKEMARIGG